MSTFLNYEISDPTITKNVKFPSLILIERIAVYMLFFALLIPLVLRIRIHIYTYDPFLAILCFSWLLRKLNNWNSTSSLEISKRISPWNWINLALITLLAWTLLIVGFAVEPLIGAINWLLLFRAIVLYFYVSANLGSVIRFKDINSVIVGSLIIECLIALAQFLTNSRVGSINDYFGDTPSYAFAYFRTSYGSIVRTVGTLHNPNLLANLLIFSISFLISKWNFGITRKSKWHYILLFSAILTLVFTFSRSGWVSFLVMLFTNYFRQITLKKRSLAKMLVRVIVFSCIIAIVLVIVVLLSLNIAALDWLKSVVFDRFANVSGGGSWRMGYVDLALQLIEKFPFLGVGLGNFPNAVMENQGVLAIPEILASDGRFSTVHNMFLLFFAESGLLGGTFWLIICLGMLYKAWHQRINSAGEAPCISVLTVWLFSSLCALMFNSNFEAVIFHSSMLIYVFFLFALAFSKERLCLLGINHLTSE